MGRPPLFSVISRTQPPSAALWPDPLTDKNISWTPACADGRSAWLVTTRCLLEEASVMERQLRRENSIRGTNGSEAWRENPERCCRCCRCCSSRSSPLLNIKEPSAERGAPERTNAARSQRLSCQSDLQHVCVSCLINIRLLSRLKGVSASEAP